MKLKIAFVFFAALEVHFLLRMDGLAAGAFSLGWCYVYGLAIYPVLLGTLWESIVRGKGEPHGD